MGLTALRFYRTMTPCCFVATWGFALGDPRSGRGWRGMVSGWGILWCLRRGCRRWLAYQLDSANTQDPNDCPWRSFLWGLRGIVFFLRCRSFLPSQGRCRNSQFWCACLGSFLLQLGRGSLLVCRIGSGLWRCSSSSRWHSSICCRFQRRWRGCWLGWRWEEMRNEL